MFYPLGRHPTKVIFLLIEFLVDLLLNVGYLIIKVIKTNESIKKLNEISKAICPDTFKRRKQKLSLKFQCFNIFNVSCV